MYDSDDFDFDEEEFIRNNLSFLNDSDDEFSESTENNSIQFQSYEESNSVYGISPISSKVSETWSSTSSGSIISPRETVSNLYRSTVCPATFNSMDFPKEDWHYSNFEDIFFGQAFTTSSRDIPTMYNNSNIDSSLYKLWSKPLSRPLFEARVPTGQHFSVASSIDTKRHYNNYCCAYSNFAYKMWPYSNYISPNVNTTSFVPKKEKPIHYFDPCLNAGLRLPNDIISGDFNPVLHNMEGRIRGLNLNEHIPVCSVHYTPLATCGAEEALNRYFNQQSNSDSVNKQFSDTDLNSLRSDSSFKEDFPVSRTSTPINISSKKKSQQFVFEQRNMPSTQSYSDAASALKTEYDFGQKGIHSQIPHKKIEKKVAHPAPITFQDFIKTDTETNASPKTTKSTQAYHTHINKQFEFCKFCYKNGELSDVYMTHVTKLPDGTAVCPILRKYVCDICGATGDKAHTRKYCPLNTGQNKRNPVFRRLTNGVLTSSHNHK